MEPGLPAGERLRQHAALGGRHRPQRCVGGRRAESGRDGDRTLGRQAWRLVNSPFPTANNAQNTLNGVAAFGSRDVWAVGGTLSNFSSDQTLALHWDGTAWSIVPSPNPSTGFNFLAGVGGTTGGHPLWAIGSQIPSNTYRTLILTATA